MRFKFMDIVSVNKGFYEGQQFYVISIKLLEGLHYYTLAPKDSVLDPMTLLHFSKELFREDEIVKI